MTAGYSGTPLAKKLGIKENYTVLLYQPPNHYFKLFSDFPDNTIMLNEIQTETADFIHIFCTSYKELEHKGSIYKRALLKNGLLWVSWPKGSSNIQTDLKRDPIREYFLGLGLVDVKVAAIDEDWSGLKFVYRLKDR